MSTPEEPTLDLDATFTGTPKYGYYFTKAVPATIVDTETLSTDPKELRVFPSGASRDSTNGKYDPEGCMSPLVEKRFAKYMLKHELLQDGSRRSSDNWQLGLPQREIMKSIKRHELDLWLHERGFGEDAREQDVEEVLCALLFNVQAYLYEVLVQKYKQPHIESTS